MAFKFNPFTGTLSQTTPEYHMIGKSYLFDDFDTATGAGMTGWSNFNAGTGAVQTITNGEANHPGIVAHNTGTTNTGRSGMVRSSASVLLGGGTYVYETVVRIPVLSNATDEFSVRCGLGDGTAADHVDGVYFEYNRASTGNYWVIKTASNSVRTSATLDGTSGNPTVAVTANTWYRLRAEINAAGTSVTFYIDTAAGTRTSVGTISTNIPTGAGRQCCPLMHILKSAGTTNVTAEVDYWEHQQKFTTLR